MKTENMTFSEALEAMKQGHKVRRTWWGENQFYCVDEGIIADETGTCVKGITSDCLLNTTDWGIYSEPKPEPQFEIGELVMMRDNDNDIWRPMHFARRYANGDYFYVPIYGGRYIQCAKFDKEIVFTNKPAKQ